MKTIRTTARIGIDQRCLQIVFAEKPREGAHRALRPLLAIVRARRGEAGGNRRRRLDRLLVERVGRWRILPKLSEPTGLKYPDDVVCSDMSQRSDRRPAST